MYSMPYRPSMRSYYKQEWWESVGPGRNAPPPSVDLPIIDRSGYNHQPTMLRDSEWSRTWPKCSHSVDAVVQTFDHIVDGWTGRRFYRCPFFQVRCTLQYITYHTVKYMCHAYFLKCRQTTVATHNGWMILFRWPLATTYRFFMSESGLCRNASTRRLGFSSFVNA